MGDVSLGLPPGFFISLTFFISFNFYIFIPSLF